MWYFSTYNTIPQLAKAIHAEALGGYVNGEKRSVESLAKQLESLFSGRCALHYDIGRSVQDCIIFKVARPDGWRAIEIVKRDFGPAPEQKEWKSRLHPPCGVYYTFCIAGDAEESQKLLALMER